MRVKVRSPGGVSVVRYGVCECRFADIDGVEIVFNDNHNRVSEYADPIVIDGDVEMIESNPSTDTFISDVEKALLYPNEFDLDVGVNSEKYHSEKHLMPLFDYIETDVTVDDVYMDPGYSN